MSLYADEPKHLSFSANFKNEWLLTYLLWCVPFDHLNPQQVLLVSAGWQLQSSPGSCLQARRWLYRLTNVISELSTQQKWVFTVSGQFEYYIGVLVGCKHFIASTKVLTYICACSGNRDCRTVKKWKHPSLLINQM